jgi:hypothetical protein
MGDYIVYKAVILSINVFTVENIFHGFTIVLHLNFFFYFLNDEILYFHFYILKQNIIPYNFDTMKK